MDREQVITGLEFTKAMITFNPSTGEDIEPGNLNEDNKITYDACVGAIALLKEQEAKQGKWERQYSRPGVYANLFWWCSVCGEPTRYNDAGIFYQYCPHCGAKLEACKDT